jgi:hypothetical protein
MTDRQSAFLAAYLGEARGNAKLAATVAGYSWPAKQGPRLTTFPEIAEAIRVGREREARKWEERWEAELRAQDEEFEAEIEREWQSKPDWYRLGFPPPSKRRGRRRACRDRAT